VSLDLADHFLGRIHRFRRIALGIPVMISSLRPFTPPAALIAAVANTHAAIEPDGGRRTRSGQRREPADPDRFDLRNRRASDPSPPAALRQR